jgi:hypothetical protein
MVRILQVEFMLRLIGIMNQRDGNLKMKKKSTILDLILTIWKSRATILMNLASIQILVVFSGMFIEVVGSTISAKISIKNLRCTLEYVFIQFINVVLLRIAFHPQDSELDDGNA